MHKSPRGNIVCDFQEINCDKINLSKRLYHKNSKLQFLACFWKCDFAICIKTPGSAPANYATKADLRDIDTTGIDTAKVTSKTDLASLKARIDNLDVDKNETAPADLSKLSNVLDNDLVKKNYVW